MQHLVDQLQVVQGDTVSSLELSDSQWRLRGISKTSYIFDHHKLDGRGDWRV